MEYIGKIIYQLRNEKKYSQAKLSKGIISTGELSKIENGESEGSYFVLCALMQRLGASIDKMESMISVKEYQYVYVCKMIRAALVQGEFETIHVLLDDFKKVKANVIFLQFLELAECVLQFLEGEKIENVCDNLAQALKQTQIQVEDYDNELLCVQEVQGINIFFYLLFLQEKIKSETISHLVKYIEKQFPDDDERCKVYPQALWLLGMQFYKENQMELALACFTNARKALVKSGSFFLLKEVLEGQNECYKQMGIAEKLEENLNYIEVLNEISIYPDFHPILIFLIENSRNTFVMSNEMIMEVRKLNHTTQESLAEEVCTQESLSRIEKKKQSPTLKLVQRIFEKLNFEKKKFQGFIISDDYHTYESVARINTFGYFKEYDEKKKEFEKLESKLDMQVIVNRQFVEYTKWRIEREMRQIDDKQLLAYLYETLEYTLPNCDIRNLYHLSRGEFMILNSVANTHRNLQQYQEAIHIYSTLYELYKKSDVRLQEQPFQMALLYINYEGVLEEANRLEEAEKIGKEGIKYAIECNRGDIAARILGNLECVYEKNGDLHLAKQSMEQSYWLLYLYEHYIDAEYALKVLKKYQEN